MTELEHVTSKLAGYLTGLKYEDLPKEAVDHTKILLLDGLGAALYGANKEWSQIIIDHVTHLGGKEEVTVFATGNKVPKSMAALANGVMIHSFELDDYHHSAKLHPGAVVIPSALAVAEAKGDGGKQLIASIVGGYEAMIRVSLGTGPASAKNRGWHLTGICGPFGAAAAAGKILNLDKRQMANALGLAGTQGSGLFAFTADGSMSKRFHPGKAAQVGINAIELVSRGFTGPTKILEAEDGGFCKAISDEYDLAKIIDTLGKEYEVLNTSIKPYSCCGSSHSAIDGALRLRDEHDLKPESIKEIIIGTSNVLKKQCGWEYTPKSILQAQMSFQYLIAIALLKGEVFIDQFTDQQIQAENVLELARKVKVEVDEDIDNVYPNKFSNKVKVILKNGDIYSTHIGHPKGSPENPLTFEQVKAKFDNLTYEVLNEKTRSKIFELIDNMEKLEDIGILVRLLKVSTTW